MGDTRVGKKPGFSEKTKKPGFFRKNWKNREKTSGFHGFLGFNWFFDGFYWFFDGLMDKIRELVIET